MAHEGEQLCIPGLIAGEDMTAKQFYIVKLSAANTVIVCDGATDVPIGVLQNNPDSGEAATVCSCGVTKISSNEAVTAGWLIGTSSDGQADRKIWGTDTTEYIIGQAIAGSGAAAGVITAYIDCAVPVLAVTSA